MPFVEGESLRTHVAKRGLLAISEVVAIARDVAKVLQYAHDHGVVHRDIEPDNVLLSGGTAVVTDFGVAKAISAAHTDGGATLTQIGTSIGTPAYMAPEQAAGDPNIDQRADLYAFGGMVHELLAGRRPPLAELVMRCLEKDAKMRPSSAAEVLRALDSVTSGGAMPAMPPTTR